MMARVRHRLTVLSCGIVAAITVLAGLAFQGWVEAVRFKPSYDLVIALDSSRRMGCFGAVVNEDYSNIVTACLEHNGESEIVLTNIPATVSSLRLFLGEEPNLEFIIRNIRLSTSKNYAAAPAHVIREFSPAEIATWMQTDVKVDTTGRAVASSRGPQMIATPKVDLAAGTPPNPNEPSLLGRMPPLLLAGMLAGVAALLVMVILFVRQFRSASSFARHHAILAAIGSVGFVMTVVTAFPGHTNFDDLYNLSEYWRGGFSDLHPALSTVVWVALIDIGKALGLSPVWQASLKLIVQSLFFWTSIVIILSWISHRWLAYLALLILALCPASIVHLGHISIDTELAIALIVAIAWMGAAAQRKSKLLLALALLPLFYGVAIRSNGAAAALPLCFFWVAIAFDILGIDLQTRRRKAIAVVSSVVIFAGLAAATAMMSRAVVVIRCCTGQQAFLTPAHDLLGVSLRVNKNLVPPELYQQPDYDLAAIKKFFDPRALNMDGLKMILPEHYGIIMRAWFQAMRDYPRAFIAHRMEVLSYFFGVHYGPAPAPYMNRFFVGSRSIGLPERARDIVSSYENQSPQFFRIRSWSEWYFGLSRDWPVYKIWIYFVAMGALIPLPIAKRRALFDPVIWLSTSALLYTLPYLLLANTAQFRYVYWTALALFCAFVLRLDAVLLYWRARASTNPAQVPAPPQTA